MALILLIDDDVDLARELAAALETDGHRVRRLERAEPGPDLVAERQFDVVLLDNIMPGMSGIDFLRALKERELSIPVILMTGCTTADTVIQAKMQGVFDYLEKPDDYGKLFKELTPLIGKALEIDWRPQIVPVPPLEKGAGDATGSQMKGTSKPMRDMYIQIAQVAPSHTSILIRGETGSGKELVARAIHTNSPRKNRPFVAMNCTTFTETLLDAELFGHEKDAFTGANKLRKGLFEHANGGTLFLDEVGEMPATLQAKLLRVLENQELTRVGGNETIKVDVRVLSATHCDLEAAIDAKTFREDLYWRLNGVTIRLPPLRERGTDLLLLAKHFLEKAAQGAGRRPPTLHPGAWDRLRAHSWSGNLRELRNVIGRAVLMCRGSQIMPDDLELRRAEPAPVAQPALNENTALAGLRQAILWAWNSGQTGLWQQLHDLLECELLRYAAVELKGNKNQIADRLGINRGTVIQRFKKYGLD